jgi:uracil-DNA glycosylase
MANLDWVASVCTKEDKDLLKRIFDRLKEEAKTEVIYPPARCIFRAIENLDSVKVVIVGQDPYHGEGQANGFAFAVNHGIAKPPSLVNIFKELTSDIGQFKTDETLEHWASQGVMLLNASLTVLKSKPASHGDLGWQKITNRIIKYLSDRREHLVFILWGKFAQSKSSIIDDEKHLIISSAHPSPFSAHQGFFGSRPFSRTNQYLTMHNIQPIEW